VKIEFIASLGVIAADPPKSRELYVDALGLPLEASEGDDYFHSERVGGSKHFGVWPLTQATRACFGGPDWPASRPVPQASIEFEVADADAVQAAAEELQAQGFELPARCADGAVGSDGGSVAVDRGMRHRHLVRAVDARRGLTEGALC
jgi:catechol 2,3-dioxygenase-like lactoylglutathione lyase family enzyme